MQKKEEGKFRYLLRQYSIDELLFMIDTAIDLESEYERKIKDAFELEQYKEEAKYRIAQKKNIHQVEGIHLPLQRRKEHG
jgi:hypothetical protein